MSKFSHISTLRTRVFFPEGDKGPPGGKNFAHPPTQPCPHFLTRACLPPTQFRTQKFQKFYLIFLLIFDYFLAQNCIRKLYPMLKTPKFALILLKGEFWSQRTIFPSPPPSSDSIPDASPPPIWPQSLTGTKKLSLKPSLFPKKKKDFEKPCPLNFAVFCHYIFFFNHWHHPLPFHWT